MERMKEVSKRVRREDEEEKDKGRVTLWNLYMGFSTKNDLAEGDLSFSQYAVDILLLVRAHTHRDHSTGVMLTHAHIHRDKPHHCGTQHCFTSEAATGQTC